MGYDVASTGNVNQYNISGMQRRSSKILTRLIIRFPYGNHLAIIKLGIKNIYGGAPCVHIDKSTL